MYLLNVLEFECSLVDGGVRNIVTFGIVKHQGQVRVHLLNTLIFIVLHLAPVEDDELSHLGEEGVHQSAALCCSCACIID